MNAKEILAKAKECLDEELGVVEKAAEENALFGYHTNQARLVGTGIFKFAARFMDKSVDHLDLIIMFENYLKKIKSYEKEIR